MNTVKIFYMALAKENIPIYGVVSYQDLIFLQKQRQKTLGEYTTKEKDAEKGIHKIPLEMSRLTDEDLVNIELIKEERMRTQGRSDSDNEEKMTYMAGMPKVQVTQNDELEQNIIYRGRTFIESKKSMMGLKVDKGKDSEEEMKTF